MRSPASVNARASNFSALKMRGFGLKNLTNLILQKSATPPGLDLINTPISYLSRPNERKHQKSHQAKKKTTTKKKKTQNRQKGMQLLLAAYMKESVRTLAGNSAVVYGCNIDFIQPRGKGNYVLNYKDVSVTCQLRELYWPCDGCGCFATGDTGKLRAPKCSSAETADLQFAESAPK